MLLDTFQNDRLGFSIPEQTVGSLYGLILMYTVSFN